LGVGSRSTQSKTQSIPCLDLSPTKRRPKSCKSSPNAILVCSLFTYRPSIDPRWPLLEFSSSIPIFHGRTPWAPYRAVGYPDRGVGRRRTTPGEELEYLHRGYARTMREIIARRCVMHAATRCHAISRGARYTARTSFMHVFLIFMLQI
jgi:hypothetical protein